MKRIVPLLLAALLLALPLCACSSKGKTLLTLEKDGATATVSVNLYELMLSRIKGSLAGSGVTSGGYAPTDPSFWNTVDKFGDSDKQQTLAEFYSAMILENCKTYVAAEWLFDTEGLTLSDAAVGDVDSRLKDLVSTYGTKTKLNAVLADYGVNYTMLRDAYLLEAKVSALQEHYFGKDGALIGENIKTLPTTTSAFSRFSCRSTATNTSPTKTGTRSTTKRTPPSSALPMTRTKPCTSAGPTPTTRTTGCGTKMTM